MQLICAFVVAYAKSRFSHDSTRITVYREKLPFVRPAPIDEQEAKKQKKQGGGGKKDKSKNVTDAVDKMAIGDN